VRLSVFLALVRGWLGRSRPSQLALPEHRAPVEVPSTATTADVGANDGIGAPSATVEETVEARPEGRWPAGVERLAQELRSSLTVIDGFTALLLQETVGPLNALQRDFLRTIQHEGARMGPRVQALAGVPQAEESLELPECSVQPLGPVLRELVARLEPLSFRKGVQLQTELPTDLPPVGVETNRLRNLLGGVLDHMIAEGAAVGRLVVRARATGGEIEISLEGSGSGGAEHEDAPADTPAKGWALGSPALQPDERASLGPGLAASRRIVEEHGGRIWIERSPNHADRLLFTLPAVHEPARREAVGAGW
jgi:signal transduction histidine kinase